MSMMTRTFRFASLMIGLGVLPGGGCAMLDPLLQGQGMAGLAPPAVKVVDVRLAEVPGERDLAAYYCPQVVGEKTAFAAGAGLLCRQFFGPAPGPDRLQVGFDIRFSVANPNRVPLPLSAILAAVTVFPGANQQQLGAVCLELCPPDAASCAPAAGAGACRSTSADIRGINDFPTALANLLVTEGLGGGQPFRAPRILAGESIELVARFKFVPESLLGLLGALVRQSASELQSGRPVSLEIPYRSEGTVFADAGSLGRVAAGFGPVAGSWAIPKDALRR